MADLKIDLTKEFKEIKQTRNGVSETIKIPMIGQGTWMLNESNTEKAVTDALKAGYVAIDTSQGYRNEELVGKAIQKALSDGLSRDKLYISSKLDADTSISTQKLNIKTEKDVEKEKNRIRAQIEKSFTALGMTGKDDYIDCYYIHAPAPWSEIERGREGNYLPDILIQWQVLNEYYDAGKIKTIGVSNFSIETLNALKDMCDSEHLQMPQVMQMPLLIGHKEEERVAFCKENNIQPIAYSILGSRHLLNHELVVAMANKYNMTPAELCTYYTTEVLKAPSLTRSTNPERIVSNSQIPNVKLSELDTQILEACNDDCREWDVNKGWHFDRFGNPRTPFADEQIEATTDGVAGIAILDLLKYADKDYSTLSSTDPDLYKKYNETMNNMVSSLRNLNFDNLNEVVQHLNPSKALLLDNCSVDINGEMTNMTTAVQSILVSQLLRNNGKIPSETAQKIYDLNWRNPIVENLKEWKKIPEYSNDKNIDALLNVFKDENKPTIEKETKKSKAKKPDFGDKLKEVLAYVDEKTNDMHLYVPYTANDGQDLDYLELILNDDGLALNVAGFDKEDEDKTTLLRFVSGRTKLIDDDKHHLSLDLSNKGQLVEVVTPITTENNSNFFKLFQSITDYSLEDLHYISKDKIPEFTTITKDLPEPTKTDIDNGGDDGNGGSGQPPVGPGSPTPKTPEGNLVFRNGAYSYYFLPFKDNGKDSYFSVIDGPGKTFINIKGIVEGEAETTCQIFSASSENINGKNLLSLELEVAGKKRKVNFPIDTNENPNLLTDINALVKRSKIQYTEIEAHDCPEIYNTYYIDSINAELSSNKPLNDDELVRTKRNGQKFQNPVLTIGNESISGIGSEIDVANLGLQANQMLTLFDSASYKSAGNSILKDALLTVSSENKAIAVFSKTPSANGVEPSTVTLNISKEFLKEFLSLEENKNVNIPQGVDNGDFVSFEVEKLKLTEDLNIKDVQIKGANSDFAVFFSALGFQVADKDKHLGILRNKEKPFDIGVTTEFLNSVHKKESEKTAAEKVCSYDNKGVGYDSLMISQIQLARQKSNTPDKIVSISLPEGSNNPTAKLYSVPLKVKNENGVSTQKYLNIKVDEKGKTYAYLHLTGENKKSKRAPKFYEIDMAHLEESTSSNFDKELNPSLYLGLNDKNNIIRINIDMDYNENAEVLKELKRDILINEFEKSVPHKDSAQPLFNGKKRTIGEESYTIYPIPKEKGSEIVSFDNTAILSRRIIEEEEPTLPKSPPLPNPPTGGPRPGPVGPSPEPKPEPGPEEPVPDFPDEDPFKPKSINWKEKLEKPKAKKKNSVRNVLIGFAALCTLLSIIVPFFAIGTVVLAGAAVVNEVKPWVSSLIKDAKEKHKKRQTTYKTPKDKEKEAKKEYAISRDSIHRKDSKVSYLESRRQYIEMDQTLSKAKRDKLLAKIDKQIEKANKDLKNITLESYNLQDNVTIAQLNKQMADEKNRLKIQKAHNKMMSSAEKTDIKALEAASKKREADLEKEKIKNERLKKEKDELSQLEDLEKMSEAGLSLTEEQMEKMRKLLAKFGKKRGRKSQQSYDSEIEESTNNIDAYTEDYNELKRQLEARKHAATEDSRNRDADESDIDKNIKDIKGEKKRLEDLKRQRKNDKTL